MRMVESLSAAEFVIDLVYDDGSVINPVSVSYTLYDGSNTAIIPNTDLTSFTAGDSTATIIITSNANALSPYSVTDEARLLVLSTTLESGEIHTIRVFYGVLAAPIGFMNRSYQTIQNAEINAHSISDMAAWFAASERDKTIALSEAFDRVGRMIFSVPYATTSLTAAAESGTAPPCRIINLLNQMSVTYAAELPEDFLNRLRLAQVIEANAILGGDSESDARAGGLISRKVGESENVWRKGSPLELPLCKRALQALTGYIHYSSKLARA